MSDRERLEQAISNVLDGVTFPAPSGYRWGWTVGPDETERRLKAAVTNVLGNPPAPPPVLEVTELADAAFREGCDSVRGGGVWDHSPLSLKIRAAGLRAAFPHLLEEFFAGLPKDDQCYITLEQFSIGPNTQAALLAAARREA